MSAVRLSRDTMDNEWAEQAKPGSWRGGPDEGDDELEVSGSRGLLCSRSGPLCLPRRCRGPPTSVVPGCLHGLSWAVVLSVVYCLCDKCQSGSVEANRCCRFLGGIRSVPCQLSHVSVCTH